MISFAINFYHEPAELIQSAIDQVRRANPNAEIFALGDGVTGQFRNCQVVEFPKRLKLAEFGGRWTHRYLSFLAEFAKFDHFIKIDPDTNTLNPVVDLPMGQAIFCRVKEFNLPGVNFRAPRGGALGFTRQMAEKIVREQYFLSKKLVNSARYGAYQDVMLMDIAAQNDLAMVNRPDFLVSCEEPLSPDASFWHK